MISVLYNIILITNFKLIEMCIKSSSKRRGERNARYPYGRERLTPKRFSKDREGEINPYFFKESELTIPFVSFYPLVFK